MEKEQFDKDLNDIKSYLGENYKDHHFIIIVSHKKNDDDEYHFGATTSCNKHVMEQGITESLENRNELGKIIFNSFFMWIASIGNNSFDFLITSMKDFRKLYNE